MPGQRDLSPSKVIMNSPVTEPGVDQEDGQEHRLTGLPHHSPGGHGGTQLRGGGDCLQVTLN